MGRAKKLKQARRLVREVVDNRKRPGVKPNWWEWLPVFGTWLKARREKKQAVSNALDERAAHLAFKRVSHDLASDGHLLREFLGIGSKL